MTLSRAALLRCLAERDSYRRLLHAALDQMHAAVLREQQLRDELQQQRDLWARCAERLFSEDES